VVGTNMLGSTPLVGQGLSAVLRGGAEVTGRTLLRFYSLHVLWLPVLTALFMWMHFHMIRRLGVSRNM
jgi:quinol-cytochrome oxidoreductase complex cytochrome b subunit